MTKKEVEIKGKSTTFNYVLLFDVAGFSLKQAKEKEDGSILRINIGKDFTQCIELINPM